MRIKELKQVFDEEQIRTRVADLAAEISALYDGEALVAVCVLKGGFMFFSDVIRRLEGPQVEVDFVRLASYGIAATSNRTISFVKDVELSLAGKHVLVVEDIIDTGHTMDFLLRQFAARGAKSLRLAVMVDKQERREVPVNADFTGFALPGGFIVGYGLDYAERYRELPAIFEVIPEY
ncbi:MAG: hypoxanthine phosphoribosyltransferase [Deltaproteobacteria bacterium]|jgi:hypoxanthine phosphoribosyltransferase|nr:hypoxanthine phosphoribosyltransferase [Deltaproteobacteria bacterium]